MKVTIDAKEGEMTVVLPYLAPGKAPRSSTGKSKLLANSHGLTDDFTGTGAPAGMKVSVTAILKS